MLQIESLAIVVLVMAFVIAFLRMKRYEYAISIWSLALSPFFYLFLEPVSLWASQQLNMKFQTVEIIILLACLMASTIILILFAGWIANRKARTIFLTTTIGFTFLLNCIYIINIL